MTTHTPQSLPDRIYAALEAPIDKWDDVEHMGLTHVQHKALRGILMDWFCEWIRDEGMVRTPGTVEVGSGAMLFAIAVIESIQEDNYGDSWPPECIQDALDYAKSNGLDPDTDSDDVLAEIRAVLAQEDTNDAVR